MSLGTSPRAFAPTTMAPRHTAPTIPAAPISHVDIALTDEGQILARAAGLGDVHATSALVRRVSPRVTSVVRLIMGAQTADVDDVVQQSLVAFVHALPAFRGECDPSGYASRIAARTAIAARRRSRARAAFDGAPLDEATETSAETDPHDQALAMHRMELLRELMETIPEEQAEAFGLRIVLGWSLEEIATTAGVPVNTVRSRMRLAKEALRRRIEADPRLLDALGL